MLIKTIKFQQNNDDNEPKAVWDQPSYDAQVSGDAWKQDHQKQSQSNYNNLWDTSNRVQPNWGSQTASPSKMTLQLQQPPARPATPKARPIPTKPPKPVAPPKKQTPSKSSTKPAASTSSTSSTKLQQSNKQQQSEPPKKDGFSLFVADNEFPTWDD